MELIPGLPNDLARKCLLRVHCCQLSTMSSLSKAWESELHSSEFWRHRKQLCNGTWQRGADMQEGRLSVYRGTSDGDRMIYVLCEIDRFTECIMVYDVMKDEWTSRIDTEEHGGFCRSCSMGSMRRMIYHSGKIHLLDKWIQGGHDNDKRVFNVSTWKWEPPQLNFLDSKTSGLCLSDDGEWYSYRNNYGTLAIYKEFTWKDIVQEPTEWKRFDYITTWKSKLLIIRGIWEEDETYDFNFTQLEARVLDLKNHRWTTLDAPKELRGQVEAGCFLEI